MGLYSRIGEGNSGIKDVYSAIPQNITIEGKVLHKDGRELRIKTNEGTTMDLVLKKNIDPVVGETLAISRREIQSMQVVNQSKLEQDAKNIQETTKTLEKIGVEDSEENQNALDKLRKAGAEENRENIEKFGVLKKLMDSIGTMLTTEMLAKLRAMGHNPAEMNVVDLDYAIKNVQEKENHQQLSTSLGKEIAVSDDQVKKMAEQLYQGPMGKDIQDIIRSFMSQGITPDKKMVDEVHDAFSKLYNLKELDSNTIVEAMDKGGEVSIELLYQLKNYVRSSNLESASVSDYAILQGAGKVSLEEIGEQIRDFLKDIGLGEEYQSIALDLVKQGKEMSMEILVEIEDIRLAVGELQELLDKNIAAALMASGEDILSMDIREILNLIKNLGEEENLLDINGFTQKEIENGEFLLAMTQHLKKDGVIGTDGALSQLTSPIEKRHLQELMYGSTWMAQEKIPEGEKTLLKVSAVLSTISDLSTLNLNYRQQHITLNHIGQRAGLIPVIEGQDREIAVNSQEYNSNNAQYRQQVQEQYNALKNTMRASHVLAMVEKGIDPMTTDIRHLRVMVENTIRKEERYARLSITNADKDYMTAQMVKNGDIWNMEKISRILENQKNKPYLPEGIHQLEEEAKARGFKELADLGREMKQNLTKAMKGKQEESGEVMAGVYRQLLEAENQIRQTKRPDKDIFEKILREAVENQKETRENPEQDSKMVQIPFYMNGEGSNANVFAKTKKSKDGGIDPEDMSVFMDLNTKGLGKLGLFLKVDHKDINISISTGGSTEGIKQQLETLSNLFGSIGYNLKNVKISGEPDTAHIEFREETTTTNMPRGLDVRI